MDAFGSLEVRLTQGFTNKCLQFVDNKTACYISGTHVCFLNLETKLQRVFQSPGRGVGVLTANCKNGIFAFSEQKLSPSIFVYTFPETRLKNELKAESYLETGLTGKSALTNYHLKTALLHLLLSKSPSSWGIESMELRLRDVLSFLQRSLLEKRLHHVLVGNSKVPEAVQVPEIIRKAEPVNLFRPLVLERELHAATVRHFHEMLRNAPVLIQEYTPHLSNGGLHHSLDDTA